MGNHEYVLPEIRFKIEKRAGGVHFYWYAKRDPSNRTSIGMPDVTIDDLRRLETELDEFLYLIDKNDPVWIRQQLDDPELYFNWGDKQIDEMRSRLKKLEGGNE